MPIYTPGKLILSKTYTPPYPSSPTNDQVYVDPNTGISWTYNSGTSSWGVTP